jgi:hypothetical protein
MAELIDKLLAVNDIIPYCQVRADGEVRNPDVEKRKVINKGL